MADTSGLPDLEFTEFESWNTPRGTSPGRFTRPTGRISEIGTEKTRKANGAVARPAGTGRGSLPRPLSSRAYQHEHCEWCRQPLGPRNQSGRTRLYCSQSCRQRAYQSRKRSRQLALREGELVVSTVLVARMNKRLRALDSALSEVENANLQATDERIWQLCQAARRLGRQVIGPPAR